MVDTKPGSERAPRRRIESHRFRAARQESICMASRCDRRNKLRPRIPRHSSLLREYRQHVRIYNPAADSIDMQ
jgi:hypothetical protein